METDGLPIAPPTHIQKAAGKALISIRKAKLLYLSELVDQVFIGPDGASESQCGHWVFPHEGQY